jgi:hypothetical protein
MAPRAERAEAEMEYRLLRSELALAQTDSLYLVLDFPRSQAVLKLRGTSVWSCDLRFSRAGSGRVARFVARYMGKDVRLVRVVRWMHLYGGKERVPPQTLEVVSKVLNASPGAIQRLLPERFLVSLGDRLFLDVRTDVDGKPRSHSWNAIRHIQETFALALGGVSLDLTMRGEEGLSLHETIHPGVPVLLIPPTLAGR